MRGHGTHNDYTNYIAIDDNGDVYAGMTTKPRDRRTEHKRVGKHIIAEYSADSEQEMKHREKAHIKFLRMQAKEEEFDCTNIQPGG